MNRSWLLASAAMLLPSLATAATFTGVAAGDMSATDAILWTRTTDATGAAIADTVTAQVATDPGFTNIVQSYTGATTVATSGTVKLDATGLGSGARYYYRFQDATATSGTGSFTTAPAADARAAVKLGFSGDADGQWRPYPSISAIAKQNLNYFVFLGDTIYETASGTAGTAAFSPAVPDASLATTPAALAAVKSAYDAKYLQNIIPVPGSVAGAQATLEPLFTATGTYTLLDNHELGNKGLQNGGAPLASATNANAGRADRRVRREHDWRLHQPDRRLQDGAAILRGFPPHQDPHRRGPRRHPLRRHAQAVFRPTMGQEQHLCERRRPLVPRRPPQDHRRCRRRHRPPRRQPGPHLAGQHATRLAQADPARCASSRHAVEDRCHLVAHRPAGQ